MREKTAKRGYDAKWRRVRDRVLRLNNQCCKCGKTATVVDHIISVKKRPDLRLDMSNLRPMCKPCHDRHTIYAQGLHSDRKPACNTNGIPTDPAHHWNKGLS